MATTTFPLNATEIARAMACPAANVKKYWPGIEAACREMGMNDVNSIIAILATIGTEVASFQPINEYGGTAYFMKHYEGRRDLGNTKPGDGARYHGRGFIQLTGRTNYRGYGKALGVPLEANPDLALDPAVSARILARYFKDRKLDEAARRRDWRRVRYRVNGGYNGWERFITLVDRLDRAVKAKKAKPAGPPELHEGVRHPAVKRLKGLIGPWIQQNVKVAQPEFDRSDAFGPGLGDAVEIFQRMNGLTPDRVVTPKVWQALERAAATKAAGRAAKQIGKAKAAPKAGAKAAPRTPAKPRTAAKPRPPAAPA